MKRIMLVLENKDFIILEKIKDAYKRKVGVGVMSWEKFVKEIIVNKQR